MCIPVHSPWLPRNIDVSKTALIILIMAGHFLDRPLIWCVTVSGTEVALHTWYPTLIINNNYLKKAELIMLEAMVRATYIFVEYSREPAASSQLLA